jgi:molybdopterin-dependent oxidoreductase alpha subunit
MPDDAPAAPPGAAAAPSPAPEDASGGGGWPLIDGWARASLSPTGPRLWQTLNHRSACLSCAWGTGGQNGGFRDELGEPLQRCLKSVEAITAELQPAVPEAVFSGRSLAQLQALSSREADRLGRLARPLILREGRSHYEPLGWDDVFELVETAFRRPPERVASYSSGRSSNEAAYLLQLLLRALGSNNLADCSDLCHAPSTIGLNRVFGSGTSMVNLEGLQHADGVVLVGSNAPANHPRLMNELIRLRERGGTVIVINPVLEAGLLKFGSPAFPIRSMLGGGSAIASLFLQPIPGSDSAVFLGLQKALLESGSLTLDVVKAHSDGWQALIAQIKTTPWEAITACCGLSREELEHTAARLAACRAVVFAWAMGITHHANGTTNVQAIANTAVLSGNVGRPGAGTMPIRGHSNVQGFGSMGGHREPAGADAAGARAAARPAPEPRARLRHPLPDRGGRPGSGRRAALPGRQPLRRQSRQPPGPPRPRPHRHDRLPGHQAQHRPLPRPGGPADPGAAGVQPLRDAAPHHGGIG